MELINFSYKYGINVQENLTWNEKRVRPKTITIVAIIAFATSSLSNKLVTHPSITPSTTVKMKRKMKFHGVLRRKFGTHPRTMNVAKKRTKEVQYISGVSAT